MSKLTEYESMYTNNVRSCAEVFEEADFVNSVDIFERDFKLEDKGIDLNVRTMCGGYFSVKVRSSKYSAKNIFIRDEGGSQEADSIFTTEADFTILLFSDVGFSKNKGLIFDTKVLTKRLKALIPSSPLVVGGGIKGRCLGSLVGVSRFHKLRVRKRSDFLEVSAVATTINKQEKK